MVSIVGFLFSKVGKMFMAVVAALGLLAGVFLAGKKFEEKDQKIEDLEEFKETTKHINEVKPVSGRDAALEFLHDNGDLR